MSSSVQPVNAFQSAGLSIAVRTGSVGTAEATGFSGTVLLTGGVETGGGLTQALRNSNAAAAAKLNWFFIAIWLKWHLVNIQQAQNYVGISAGSSCRFDITDPHRMVDEAIEKKR